MCIRRLSMIVFVMIVITRIIFQIFFMKVINFTANEKKGSFMIDNESYLHKTSISKMCLISPHMTQQWFEINSIMS